MAAGLAFSCEGGPLGSVMLPLVWTDRGPAAAATALSYEALADLAEVIMAVKARHAG